MAVTWDDVKSMGAADYTLGRPYRAEGSPHPLAYAWGWDEAAAYEAHENRQEALTHG